MNSIRRGNADLRTEIRKNLDIFRALPGTFDLNLGKDNSAPTALALMTFATQEKDDTAADHEKKNRERFWERIGMPINSKERVLAHASVVQIRKLIFDEIRKAGEFYSKAACSNLIQLELFLDVELKKIAAEAAGEVFIYPREIQRAAMKATANVVLAGSTSKLNLFSGNSTKNAIIRKYLLLQTPQPEGK